MTGAITVGVAIGTSSFLLFAVAWVVAWIFTVREQDDPVQAPDPAASPAS